MNEVSRTDQLIACAWWNVREADMALGAAADANSSDTRAYYLRRHARLYKQAQNLFAEATNL